ncbi:winged helix-turn-helix domain-containing protein [Caulobacter segnis]|uniref:winged helix-turn-helix domain-containing protein n=1 Tax=Caulobacter segnis TaxID=88688 RepID=UPI001CBBA30E|nr:winged helix-turn-helix domain-containing protein [Caulobacter segnis]UAL09509.1 winged helix-turn-helix domain-containing protein [Caulobacter segnis]
MIDASTAIRSSPPDRAWRPAWNERRARPVILLVGDDALPCADRSQALRGLAFQVVDVPNTAAAQVHPLKADLFIVEGLEQYRAHQRFYDRRRLSGEARAILIDHGDDLASRIAALEAGADDVVRHDCTVRELWARIKCVLGAHRPHRGPARHEGGVFQIVGLGRFHAGEMALHAPGAEPLHLGRVETAVLQRLCLWSPAQVSREEILDSLPPDLGETIFDRALDRCVSRLRRRLASIGGAGLIETCRGSGYKLSAPVRRIHG